MAFVATVFADMNHDIGPLVATEPYVACQYTFRGRHIGTMPLNEQAAALCGRTSLEPTGRIVTLTGMFVAVVRAGQLHGGWGEFDRLGLLAQLNHPTVEADGLPG